MDTPCPLLAAPNGCRFEPRYDTVPATAEALAAVASLCDAEFLNDDDIAAIEALRGRRYRGDVCIRCGKRSQEAG